MSGAKHTPGPWAWVRRTESIAWVKAASEINDFDVVAVARVWLDANAHLIAAAPDLLEALEVLQQFFAMADEGSIERFDRLAEQYRRETGKWAPWKSIPGAYNDSTEPEVQRADYDAWVQSKVEAARAAIAKARGQA